MAEHKFYGIVVLMDEVVARHKEGRPIVPASVRGNLQVIIYDDEAEPGYVGGYQAFGTMIKCTTYSELIHTANFLLDKGATIHSDRASIDYKGVMTCSYELPKSDLPPDGSPDRPWPAY